MEEVLDIRLDEDQVAATAERVKTVCDAIGMRVDDNESIFLARELEQIKAKEFETRKPPRRGRLLVPISTEISPDAESYTYRVYDETGAAKIITDYAGDLPSFDALAKEVTAKVYTAGGEFHYSVQELRSAIKAGRNLEARKQKAAVRGFEKMENDIILSGQKALGTTGLINSEAANGGNVPTLGVLADGAGGLKTWASKTAEQIIRDLDAMLISVRTTSKGEHEVNVIVLPLSSYGLINSKPFSTSGGSDKTVLSWWLANHPGVEVTWLNELETAGTGGVKRMIGYVRDPEMLECEIPSSYEQLPPQADGLMLSVPCFSRIGGVSWYFPLSAVYSDGI